METKSKQWLVDKLQEIVRDNEEVLILVRGLPGIGKTTFLKELVKIFENIKDIDIIDDNESTRLLNEDGTKWRYHKVCYEQRISEAKEKGYKKFIFIGSGQVVKWINWCDYLFDLTIPEELRIQRMSQNRREGLQRKNLRRTKMSRIPMKFEYREHAVVRLDI